jgi:acetyltransferase-like isoleucine patch superfamily enzyme
MIRKVIQYLKFFKVPLVKKNVKPSLLNVIGAQSNNFFRADTSLVKGRFEFDGINNSLSIKDGATVSGRISIQGKNNIVIFNSASIFRGRLIVRGDNQVVSIGSHTTFQSVYMLCQEGCNIQIGDWCMFSRDIEIRTTDAHSVVDVKSRKRVNTPGSVNVGNHVWVGVGSLISKGSTIPNDSIIGAYSFVNKEYTEENVLIAGTPAKIVRHGVTWNRGRKSKFTQAQLEHWKDSPSKTE